MAIYSCDAASPNSAIIRASAEPATAEEAPEVTQDADCIMAPLAELVAATHVPRVKSWGIPVPEQSCEVYWVDCRDNEDG